MGKRVSKETAHHYHHYGTGMSGKEKSGQEKRGQEKSGQEKSGVGKNGMEPKTTSYAPPPDSVTANMDKISVRTTMKATEFTWTIDHFSVWIENVHNKNELSPVFQTGEHRWRLYLTRNNLKEKGYIGLFLSLRGSSKQNVSAGYQLAILNDEGKRTCETGIEYKTFNPTEVGGWGEPKFIRNDILLNKTNGYLSKSNDALTLVCEIHVFQTLAAQTSNSRDAF